MLVDDVLVVDVELVVLVDVVDVELVDVLDVLEDDVELLLELLKPSLASILLVPISVGSASIVDMSWLVFNVLVNCPD